MVDTGASLGLALGPMPIYPRKDRKTKKPIRGQYRIVLWSQGQRQEKQFAGTKKEAESYLARWQIELEASAPVDERRAPTFSHFLAGRYRVHAEVALNANTWSTRKYMLATLNEHFGEMLLTHITAQDVEEYQLDRLKVVGPVSCNNELRVLKRVLNYARSIDIPAVQIKTPALPEPKVKGRVQVWTADEVTQLYKAFAAESPHLLAITVCLLNTGMRKGEALALEWDRVDLDAGMILIHPSKDWRPKSNEPREVPIGSALLPWLTGPRESERWVFPAPRTGSRYVVWPQKQWDRARVASKVGGSPHVCRHTYASHFLSARGDMFLLAKILGHTHERVTAIYSHLLPDHLERARDAVSLPAPIGLVGGKG